MFYLGVTVCDGVSLGEQRSGELPDACGPSKSHQHVRSCRDVYNEKYRQLHAIPGKCRALIASCVQMRIPESCVGEV